MVAKLFGTKSINFFAFSQEPVYGRTGSRYPRHVRETVPINVRRIDGVGSLFSAVACENADSILNLLEHFPTTHAAFLTPVMQKDHHVYV